MKQDDRQMLAATGAAGGENDDRGYDIVAAIRGALYGRWMLAAAVACVLGMGLGTAGYLLASRAVEYQSVGRVRVISSRPPVIVRNEFNERMPAYESYRNSRAEDIRSERVVTLAVRDEKLREVGWPEGTAGVRALHRALRVTVPRNQEYILVAAQHSDPIAAREAVNAVLRSFERLQVEFDARQSQAIEDRLIKLRDDSRRELNDAQRQVLALGEEHGTDNLDFMLQSKRRELDDVSRTISRFEQELAFRADDVGGVAPQDPAFDPSELSIDELATLDAELDQLQVMLRQVELDMDLRRDRIGPGHHEFKALQHQADTIRERIEARADEVRTAIASGDDAGLSSEPIREITTGEIRRRLSLLMGKESTLQQEVLLLGQTQLRIDYHQQRAEAARETLDRATTRLEEIRTERRDEEVGRVQISHYGDRPLSPATDRRRQLAAAGLVFGGGAGLGLVALPGLLRPAYRSISQISDDETRFQLLGAMPRSTPYPAMRTTQNTRPSSAPTSSRCGVCLMHREPIAATGPCRSL